MRSDCDVNVIFGPAFGKCKKKKKKKTLNSSTSFSSSHNANKGNSSFSNTRLP